MALTGLSDNLETEDKIIPKLISNIMSLIETFDDVIACGVPGAGGHDAFYVVMRGGGSEDRLTEILKSASPKFGLEIQFNIVAQTAKGSAGISVEDNLKNDDVICMETLLNTFPKYR